MIFSVDSKLLWRLVSLSSILSQLVPVSAAATSYANNGHQSKRQDYTVQAGAHVIYSYSGTTIPSELYTLASQGQVGGVIIFGGNVDSSLPSQLSKLQSTYASSSAYLGQPLLIVTDQEGGEVVRLPGGPSQSEKSVGSSSNPSAAANSAGAVAASACEAYSINGNLAPVLGVYRQAGDFLDQYDRSYSMNANIVNEAASAFISAQQSHGVAATAKHFPGLGAATASQNTDAEPVTLHVSLSDLRSIDELPYTGAISAGVDMVMPSWAVYPALDTVPAGLSETIIGGELRQRLGFEGVTISDAIEAGALEAYGSNETRAISAMNAGMDLILAAAQDYTQGQAIVQAIVDAVEDGSLQMQAFSGSTSRILKLRSKL